MLFEDEMKKIAIGVIERIEQELDDEDFLDNYGGNASKVLSILSEFGSENHKNKLAKSLDKWMKRENGVEKLLMGFAQKSYNPKNDRYNFSKFDVGSYSKLKEVVGKEGVDSIFNIIENKYPREFLFDSEYVGTTDLEKVAFAFWDEHYITFEMSN